MKKFVGGTIFILLLSALLTSCGKTGDGTIRVEGKNLNIIFDQQLHSKIVAKFGGEEIPIGEFSASEIITVSGKNVSDFAYNMQSSEKISDAVGSGVQHHITGVSATGLQKDIAITLYDDFPQMAVYKVTYTNNSDADIVVDGWTNNRYSISAKDNGADQPSFWSYQSGSYESRPDWVLPISAGFSQQNYMGMNDTDYGGGTPISDVWRKDVGIAVGHLALVPKLVSLPVEMADSAAATLAVQYAGKRTLKKGTDFTTIQTFVAVHQKDYFNALSEYRRMMEKRGIQFDKPKDSAYQPVWCAWGYERNFTVDQIYKTLPEVKKLGFEWAVLDDGWQTAEGDWYLNKAKFPHGDRDMRKFVKTINGYGLKAKLWWAPLAVDPGTDLIKNHPEYLLLNKDGSKQKISWWDAYYLCPAYPPVQEYTKNLVTKIMKTWGYEGLKIDGQHLNGAPPCYNPAHHHARPEESVESVPAFFKTIYETALAIHKNAVVEICPCGTAYSFFNLPYMNQAVSSDPESSWQIRLKGKTFKALMGPQAPYYGDHVELSDGGRDFASTVGVGGIIGTKFTWPVGAHVNTESGDVSLTPGREAEWAKWNNIYREKMLPKGDYLGGLYDIGFDKPEAHAIRKDGKMYYAFYAKKWNGEIELRGLDAGKYVVKDYVNNRSFGKVQGPVARLKVAFEGYLLLEVVTVEG